MADDEGATARVRLPSWIWGSAAQALGAAAGWDVQAGPALHEWDVRLADWRENRPARLLDLNKMGHRGNVDSPGSFSRLHTLPPHDRYLAESTWETVQAFADRLGEEPPTAGRAMYQASLVTQSAPEAVLPTVIRSILRDQLFPVLRDASVWLISVDETLTARYQMPKVVLQFEDDPTLLTSSAEDFANKFAGFASARSLLDDTVLGLDAYLAPLFLSLTPYVWGFSAGRAGGVVVYNFGEVLPGQMGETVEPLQLFHPRSSGYDRGKPVTSPGDLEATLKWWVERLNILFREATNPREFRSPGGEFAPRRQLETLLSVEQAFRNLQSISALDRDSHASRLICLDTLDTLEGMNLLSVREMTLHSKAEAELVSLEKLLPESVARILLPRARRGVESLKKLQSGFFLPSRVGSNGVRLPDKQGGEQTVSYEVAVAAWLRVLRNAGHAFGGKQGVRARDEALLIAHDGSVPEGFSDLAYLYVLRLLNDPRLLHKNPGLLTGKRRRV